MKILLHAVKRNGSHKLYGFVTFFYKAPDKTLDFNIDSLLKDISENS